MTLSERTDKTKRGKVNESRRNNLRSYKSKEEKQSLFPLFAFTADTNMSSHSP